MILIFFYPQCYFIQYHVAICSSGSTWRRPWVRLLDCGDTPMWKCDWLIVVGSSSAAEARWTRLESSFLAVMRRSQTERFEGLTVTFHCHNDLAFFRFLEHRWHDLNSMSPLFKKKWNKTLQLSVKLGVRWVQGGKVLSRDIMRQKEMFVSVSSVRAALAFKSLDLSLLSK